MTIAEHQNIYVSSRRVLPIVRGIIALWLRRMATRRHLRDLEVHRLDDVGFSEAERRRECAKWFWQK